jgi:hypothetical protein
MSTKVTTQSPLLTAHADAVAKYGSATTAGVKAGLTRKIADLELELTVESIPFDSWTPPRKSSAKRPSRNDAELMARIDTIRQIRDDSQHPQSVRDTADRHLAQLVKQATARGLIHSEEAEETPEPTKTKTRKGKTAGDQLAAINAKVAA